MTITADITAYLAEADALAVSAASMLSMVRTAIAALVIRNESSYVINGRSVTMQDLGALQKLEIHYAKLAASEARSSGGLLFSKITNVATSA